MKSVQWIVLIFCIVFAAVPLLSAAPAKRNPASVTEQEIRTLLSRLPAQNRLMVDFSRWTPERAKKSFAWESAEKIVMINADHYMQQEPLKREIISGRLLAVANQFLDRVLTLSMAWKLTGNDAYVHRAIREMHSAAEFADWHPKHFLDTAALTLGMAFGCDFLDPFLTDKEKTFFRKMIVEKGLKPSEGQFWVSGSNNWTQVCHAGMVAGALVCADAEPELAARLIRSAIVNLPKVMKISYAPQGCYPEGPSYWSYGTTYNCFLIAFLDHAFGQNFGLSDLPGWSETGTYYSSAFTPHGATYHYYDGQNECVPTFACFYHDAKFPGKLYFSPASKRRLAWYSRQKKLPINANFVHLSLFYMDENTGNAPPPALWYTGGKGASTALLMARSAWTEDALYLGFKGGSARDSHAHMDAGSFVIANEGVYFVQEMGNEIYHNIEKRGIKLWDTHQDADRWKLFRYGMQGHSVIRINDDMQNVKGKGVFAGIRDLGNGKLIATLDLSSLYDNAAKVTRTADFSPERIIMTDRLSGLRPGAKISFQYMTYASLERRSDGALLMIHNGKKMLAEAKIPGSDAPQWKDRLCSEMLKPYERDTGKARAVSFDLTVPASGKVEYSVIFTPIPEKK